MSYLNLIAMILIFLSFFTAVIKYCQEKPIDAIYFLLVGYGLIALAIGIG